MFIDSKVLKRRRRFIKPKKIGRKVKSYKKLSEIERLKRELEKEKILRKNAEFKIEVLKKKRNSQ